MSDDAVACPKCFSTNLTTGTKGVSITKALIFLPLGLKGRKDVVITCLKCGHRFSPGEGASRVPQRGIDIDAVNRGIEERRLQKEAEKAAVQGQERSRDSLVSELAKLADLKSKGLLTEEEFEKAKKKLLG